MDKPAYIRVISAKASSPSLGKGRFFVAEVSPDGRTTRLLDPLKAYKCVATMENKGFESSRDYELALRRAIRAVLNAEVARVNKPAPVFTLNTEVFDEPATDLSAGSPSTRRTARPSAPWSKPPKKR